MTQNLKHEIKKYIFNLYVSDETSVKPEIEKEKLLNLIQTFFRESSNDPDTVRWQIYTAINQKFLRKTTL